MEKTFKRSMVLLILVSIILICTMLLAHIYMVYQSNNQEGEGIVQNLISMQSITLAVTGISVTVVSIVVSLISIYREKKIEEAERLINNLKQELSNVKNDTKQKQEKLNENLKRMINMLALQASEFSEQYFDNILSCIDNIEVEELEDTIKTQMSFVMVNTVEKIYDVSNWEVRLRHSDSINKEAYEKIIKYSKYMLQDKNLNKELYDFAILKYAFYLYELARLEERTEGVKAKEHFKEAYELIVELKKMKDTNGYIHYLCGIITLWLGKTENIDIKDSERQLKRFKEALLFLDEALIHDQNFRFLNNKAVVLMNIAYNYKRQGSFNLAVEYLLSAKKELLYTLQYNEKYYLVYNNLANINRNLFEIKIGICDLYAEYKNISFLNLKNKDVIEVEGYIKEAYKYLKESIKIAPSFIDNYYNMATICLYEYVLKERENRKFIKIAKEMINKAEKINPQCGKMLAIKKIIYEIS